MACTTKSIVPQAPRKPAKAASMLAGSSTSTSTVTFASICAASGATRRPNASP